jgi:hypothetical protein
LEAGFIRDYWKNMRMFVFDTYNGYSTYCRDTQCDFVQIDPRAWLDVDWGQYSSYGGSQYEVPIQIVRSYDTPPYQIAPDDNWWVQVDGVWLGYWPNTLFHDPGLRYFGLHTSYGGEVFQWNPTRHTATAMGSGVWPSASFGYSAYQSNLQYVDLYGNWQKEDGLTPIHDSSPNCYWSQYFQSSDPFGAITYI